VDQQWQNTGRRRWSVYVETAQVTLIAKKIYKK